MKIWRKVLKEENGASLVFTLLAFLVLMIFMSSLVFVFGSNHKQAVRQKDQMESYYLALSGVDVVKSTLIMPLYVETDEEKNMMDRMKNHGPSRIEDSFIIDGQEIEVSVQYDNSRNLFVISSEVVTSKGAHSRIILEIDSIRNREKWIQ